jgi:hypothetical protein
MGLSRQVDTDIWTHHGIADLSALAKLVYLFLYINPNSDKCGCVRLSKRLSAVILCVTEVEFDAAVGQLSRIVREFDGLFAIRGWIKHNCKNETWRTAAEAALAKHPPEVQAWVQGETTLPPPYPHPTPTVPLEVVEEVVVESGVGEEKDLPKASPSRPRPAAGDASKIPECPHQEILDAYHELLPELCAMRSWTDHRKTLLRARWREEPKRQNVEWWRTFFSWVRKSDFLMGRGPGKDGQAPFQADLEWLIRPRNFAKLADGKYHRNRPAMTKLEWGVARMLADIEAEERAEQGGVQ